MNEPLPPDKIHLLLGGYATGSLTPEENAALMAAALEDQILFDALMDEEALRETLADPATRVALLRALRSQPEAAVEATPWWSRPWPWAALVTATAAAMLFVLLRPAPQTEVARQESAQQAVQEIAANLPKPQPVPSGSHAARAPDQ